MRATLASAGVILLGVAVLLIYASTIPRQASPAGSVSIPSNTPAQVQVHLETPAGPIWPTANYGLVQASPDDSEVTCYPWAPCCPPPSPAFPWEAVCTPSPSPSDLRPTRRPGG